MPEALSGPSCFLVHTDQFSPLLRNVSRACGPQAGSSKGMDLKSATLVLRLFLRL